MKFHLFAFFSPFLVFIFSCTSGQSLMTGVVQLGRVSGASLNFYVLNSDGSSGDLLGSTQTDSKGEYSAYLPKHQGPVAIHATGGTYTDLATGQTVSNTSISAVILDGSGDATIPVTAISHLVYQEFLNQIRLGKSTSESLTIAKNKVAETLGLEVTDLELLPPSPSSETELSEASVGAVRVAFKLSVISELVKAVKSSSSDMSTYVDSVLATLAQSVSKASGSVPTSMSNDKMQIQLSRLKSALGTNLAGVAFAAHVKALTNSNAQFSKLPTALLIQVTSLGRQEILNGLSNSGPVIFLKGDINKDGIVSVFDSDALSKSTKFDSCNNDCTWEDGDFNGDRLVDILDISEFLANQGQSIYLPGDMNKDGKVDATDAISFSSSPKFDQCTNQAPCTWNEGDFNGDGLVDIYDGLVFLFDYTNVVTQTATAVNQTKTGTPTYLPGDINRDGMVSFYDTKSFIAKGKYDNCSSSCSWTDGDFNGDGRVDILDASALSSYLGQSIYTPGDINKDGKVDALDGTAFSASTKFDKCTEQAPCTWDEGDFNGDGLVDIYDSILVLLNTGR